LAQDVQPVIVGIVTVQDNDQQTLGVSYTELIPVLINAIKEQQAQIEMLQAKNKNQSTAAMADVLKRLMALEDTVEGAKQDMNSVSLAD